MKRKNIIFLYDYLTSKVLIPIYRNILFNLSFNRCNDEIYNKIGTDAAQQLNRCRDII